LLCAATGGKAENAAFDCTFGVRGTVTASLAKAQSIQKMEMNLGHPKEEEVAREQQVVAESSVSPNLLHYLHLAKGEFRLLELPPSQTGHIVCHLQHCSIDQSSFVCLSYTWGSAKDPMSIECSSAPI